jgi:hypothetical protein
MKPSSEKDSKFMLSKWYMDCVTDNGEVFIAYWGILRWKGISIHYASLLMHDDAEGTRVKTSLRRHLPPQAEASGVRWVSDSLGFEGKWISSFPPVEKELLASDEGTIQWQCRQPGAIAHLLISPGKSVSGFGYTEQIRMTIKPWLLPMDELRWGRFVSETDSLVWIEWRGERPQTPVIGRLRLYQWLGIGCVAAGAVLTGISCSSEIPVPTLDWRIIASAAVFGVLSLFAYGVDFPYSNRRFSMLV